MNKRYGRLGKILVVLSMGALVLASFSSLALAQKGKELQDAAKMMSDGWKIFDDGQRMIIKGVEMNNLVAVQGGFQDLMAPGNKVIQDGRNTIVQASTLFARGEKTYLDNKQTPRVAIQGVGMMLDAIKIAKDGSEMVKKGVAMNDQVAKEKGAVDKFAQGNKVIQDGLATMATGVKSFLEGEKIYLELKKK